MPPAIRRVSLADALTAFTAQSEVVQAWAAPLETETLSEPSRLTGWTIRDVLAHLTVAVEALHGAVADRRAPLAVADYVSGYAPAAEHVRDQAADLQGDPRERFAQASAGVRQREVWPATVVMWDDPLTVGDAVATRVLELVVHGDDLGMVAAPSALALSVRLLTGVLATRHPGRAVEVRVAPYAAVQILEGTVHRRGTPTAVVSFDPLTWLRVATGRLSWSAAEATGAIAASGERSDLSAYLPLLR